MHGSQETPATTAGNPKVSQQNLSRAGPLSVRTTYSDRSPHPAAKPLRPTDKAFRIATPMRKASWTKRFAAGWGERRGANGDGGSGGEGWREWAGGVSEKSLPMRAAFEKPRPLGLEDAAQGCRNRRFRSPARQGHGTPKRGYSPRNRVRQLPQWGHRGRAASRSAASSTARSAGSVSSLNASERLDILSGCAASAGVARIKSNQARLDWSRFEGCQSP